MSSTDTKVENVEGKTTQTTVVEEEKTVRTSLLRHFKQYYNVECKDLINDNVCIGSL